MRTLVQIGDVKVCDGEPPNGNPYLDRSKYRIGRERVAALRLFHLGQPTGHLTLWSVPCAGGAKRITAADVDWERSGVPLLAKR